MPILPGDLSHAAMSLISLVYASSAVTPLDDHQLGRLLDASRAKNAALDVTGMLLYRDGNFMQALEGDEDVVLELERRIRYDRRHRGVLRLLKRPIVEREFPEWSMGFRRLGKQLRVPGETDTIDLPLTDLWFAKEPTRAQKLLLTFREMVRA